MDNSEKISIIIPVYNVEKFLGKCLDSVLNQTYSNLEVILIDDGSPDNCGKICDEYAAKDSRIKVVHQENGGLCAARNTGLKLASGEYIGFVDSDDYVEADMYEYLLNGIKEFNADISACRYYRHYRDGRIVERKTDGQLHIFDRDEAIRELLKLKTIKASFTNKLFKAKLLENVVFPEGLLFEGTFMVHNIFRKCERVVYLPEAKYFYYDFEQSIVNDKSLKHQCNYVLAQISRYKDLIDDYPDQKKRMIKKIFKEITLLTKIGYLEIDGFEKNIESINEIGDFVRENHEYFIKNNSTKRVGSTNLNFVMNPTRANLKKAHFRQMLLDTKKDREISRKLKASRKEKNNEKV